MIAFAFITVNAQQAKSPNAAPENKNAPVITFDKKVMVNGKPVHDYGTIIKGGDGKCFFAFQNTGKEPLIISNCRSSCGCTVPSPPKYPILPGQHDTIWVKYNTKKMGTINKTVTVTSNSKNSPVVMRIKGKVINAPEEALPEKNLEGSGSPVNR